MDLILSLAIHDGASTVRHVAWNADPGIEAQRWHGETRFWPAMWHRTSEAGLP